MRAIVLAAGEGRRFGGPKQTADLDGRPLLRHALDLVAGLRPIVVLGARADHVAGAVGLADVEVVRCAAWATGRSASLRAGIAALDPGEDAALVLLGDQPRLGAAVVKGTIARRDDARFDAVRPTFAGAPGHPVLLTRAVLDRAPELRGDDGARGLLRGMRLRTWAADGLGDPRDVDVPADLDALTAPSATGERLSRHDPPPTPGAGRGGRHPGAAGAVDRGAAERPAPRDAPPTAGTVRGDRRAAAADADEGPAAGRPAPRAGVPS